MYYTMHPKLLFAVELAHNHWRCASHCIYSYRVGEEGHLYQWILHPFSGMHYHLIVASPHYGPHFSLVFEATANWIHLSAIPLLFQLPSIEAPRSIVQSELISGPLRTSRPILGGIVPRDESSISACEQALEAYLASHLTVAAQIIVKRYINGLRLRSTAVHI